MSVGQLKNPVRYWLGKHRSEETKNKLRLANLGKKQTEETKNKLRIIGLKFRHSQETINKMKGHKVSDETKRKIGIANKNKKIWITGKHHSMETKRKISEAQKGEKANNWKNGVTSINKIIRESAEYHQWRKSIFERDSYRCIICGKVGGILNAHHIKSFSQFPEIRFDINNGITLCIDCHKIGKKETPLFF